jgi:hypothetical protein
VKVIVTESEHMPSHVELHVYTDTGLKLIHARDNDYFPDQGYEPFIAIPLNEPNGPEGLATLSLPRDVYEAIRKRGHTLTDEDWAA